MKGLRKAWMVGVFVLLPVLARAEISFDLTYAVGGHGIGRESFDGPVDVVEDREENIYVVDQGNNRIQVLDRRGRFVREWGSRGFTPGKFDTPTAIAINRPGGTLYVVDRLNHRIQKFDLNGKMQMTFGKLGSGTGDFNNPTDVALDRKGNIYVADSGNNRIQKFDPSGKFLAEWGKFKKRGAQLNNPVSLAYSDEGFGNIFVVNGPDCRVQKFDIDGNFLLEWTMHKKGEGFPCGLSRIRIEPRLYTVYISDTENDRVMLFGKDGESLGDLKEGKVPLKKPAGLFVSDAFGETVTVADTGNHLIQKFRRVR